MAIRAHSVSNLLRKKYKLLPFTGEWYDAFSHPEAGGVWFVYGESGNGKTNFSMQLARYMDEHLKKRIAYLSLEESTAHTMQQAVIRSQWKEKGGGIKILEPASIEDVDAWLKKHKSPDVLIIDTVQRWEKLYDITEKKLLEFNARHKKKLIIYISHVKGGEPHGSKANTMMRDASLKIYVQGYRAFSKGRYFGEKGYYSIWAEKEKEIW